jgi:AhpC/TSA antioxidant enzyme
VQLHRAQQEFEQAGVGLVLIGQATPRHAKHFARKLKIDDDMTILADEDRTTYKAVGFRKANVGQLLGPKSVVTGLKHSARSGVMQGRVIGDAAQLGGAVVITRDGEVAFQQASEHAGDTVDPHDLLRAAGEATAA